MSVAVHARAPGSRAQSGHALLPIALPLRPGLRASGL